MTPMLAIAPKRQINILMLSRSGCGKSTFINALANYLAFNSLDDAIINGPKCLIPLAFTKWDRVIKIGDVQEDNDVTSSNTQTTTSYEFDYKEIVVRFFDTPGIGDTEGIAKDMLNMKNIVSCISKYEHLNAILIMMQPNLSRLDAPFLYCISELLKHLHRDASKNILFCFTNASATNYEAGDSIPVVRKVLNEINQEHGVEIELSKRTTFNVDNMSFRYLCEAKDEKFTGIKPSAFAYMNSNVSWDISVKEINRMFDYILQLPVHQISKTVALNKARTMIILLSKPLADITENITNNIALAKKDKERIQGLDMENANWEKELRTQKEYATKEKITEPNTVCMVCSTVERGKSGENIRTFNQICHEGCQLGERVTEETTGEPSLRDCAAMATINEEIRCEECGCSWEKHMHVYYTMKKETVWEENAAVAKDIKSNCDKKSIMEKALAELDLKVKKYEDEHECINNTAAQFGTFLKRNGIIAHNKYVEEYVQMQIEMANKIKDAEKVANLKKMLDAYHEQRKIIEQHLDSSNETIDLADIEKSIQKLFALELTGKMIQDLYQAEQYSHDMHMQQQICYGQVAVGDHLHQINKSDPRVNQEAAKEQQNLVEASTSQGSGTMALVKKGIKKLGFH